MCVLCVLCVLGCHDFGGVGGGWELGYHYYGQLFVLGLRNCL